MRFASILLIAPVCLALFAASARADPDNRQGQGAASGNPMTRVMAKTGALPAVKHRLDEIGQRIGVSYKQFALALTPEDLAAIKRGLGDVRPELGQVKAGLNDRLRQERKAKPPQDTSETEDVLEAAEGLDGCIGALNDGTNELLSGGYPNGRRPGDDIADIELKAAYGLLAGTLDAFSVAPEGARSQCVSAVDQVIKIWQLD